MDDKSDCKDDEKDRERAAAELQAQIDDIISGKGETEVKTLRDLTRVHPDSTAGQSEKSQESGRNDESEG